MRNNSIKQRVCAIIMLGCAIVSYAQDNSEYQYKSLVEQGKTWWYVTSRGDDDAEVDPTPIYFCMQIDGDTVINDIVWKKIWYLRPDKSKVISVPVHLIKENNKKIELFTGEIQGYQIAKEILKNDTSVDSYDYLILKHLIEFSSDYKLDGMESVALYDFNVPESYTQFWPWSGMYTYCSFSDDNEYAYDLNANAYKCYTCHSVPYQGAKQEAYKVKTRFAQTQYLSLYEQLKNPNADRIIEGIGILNVQYSAGFFFLPYPLQCSITGVSYNLPYVSQLIFITDSENNIIFRMFDSYNEPWSGSDINSVLTPHSVDLIYDIYGRKVTNPISGNIYIKNGNKFIQTRETR